MLGRAAERLGDSNPIPHGGEDDLLVRKTAVWLRNTTAAMLQYCVAAVPFFPCLLSLETGHHLSGAEPATPNLLHLSFTEDTFTDLEPLLLHLAKKNFLEDQYLLLLFSFSSSTSKKIPLNRPRSPSGSLPRPNRPPLLCHIHRKEPPSSLPGTHEPADISHRGEAGLDIKHQNLMTLPPEVLRPDTHKARRPF